MGVIPEEGGFGGVAVALVMHYTTNLTYYYEACNYAVRV